MQINRTKNSHTKKNRSDEAFWILYMPDWWIWDRRAWTITQKRAPYKRIFTCFSAMERQEKWDDDTSAKFLQRKELIQFSKLWLNLFSLKLTKASLNLVISFMS